MARRARRAEKYFAVEKTRKETERYVTSALVKDLHGVGGDWDPIADMQIAGQDRVDVGCEFGALVIVQGVSNVVVGTLDLDHLLARGLVIAAAFAQL